MPSSKIKYVEKGWGYEKWIVNSPEYCGKILFFEKGKRCSWHYHLLKDETFYLQSGRLHLFYGQTDDLRESFIIRAVNSVNVAAPSSKEKSFTDERSKYFVSND